MKITCEWEPKDIIAGRYIIRQGGNHSTAYKIGFGHLLADKENRARRYVLVAITDGMITKAKTKEEMAIDLTKGDYVPLSPRKLIEHITKLEIEREQAIEDGLYNE